MFSTTLWTLFYLLGYSSQTLDGKILWLRVKYIPSTITPLIWFYFSLEFTKSNRWIRNRWVQIGLIVYLILTWLVVFSSDLHGMMWQEVWIAPGQPEELVIHGFYFWIYLATSYLALFMSFVVYVRYYSRAASIYKMQALTIAIASIFPLLASILFLFFNINLIPLVDDTIFFLLFSELFFAWSLFGFRSFELIPIANEIIVKDIPIGILVFDRNNKIVEINPTAQKLLRISNDHVVGKSATMVFNDKDDIFVMNDIDIDVETEIENNDSGEVKYLSLHQSPIFNKGQEFLGRIMLITDITERKKQEIMLRNFATYDEMTKVFNRRHFFVLAEKELLRAIRYSRSISIIIFDIDNFKHFNDVYGHSLGDAVITHVAGTVLKALRDSDIFARYGGDEFIILFPEISKECSIKAVNRLRDVIKNSVLRRESEEFPVTLSYGIAHWDGSQEKTLEQIIHHADMALLKAKKLGRDRFCIWPEDGLPEV